MVRAWVVLDGGRDDSRTPVDRCRDRIAAGRRGTFRVRGDARRNAPRSRRPKRLRPRSPRRPRPRRAARWRGCAVVLRGRRRARGDAVADRAVEGRAAARHLRRGEAARRRAFADRPRRQRRRQIARAPRRAAVFLVRRGRSAGRRHVARDAGARPRRRPSAARSRRDIAVRRRAAPPPPSAAPGSVWPLRNTWNRATENLYSAWIEKLFDAPLDAQPSWKALHEVLRDRSRNMLFNHLGLGEDEMKHRHAPRLRRPAVFPARLFRLQDGAAVRLLEVHARRRRPAAEVLRSGSTSKSRVADVRRRPPEPISRAAASGERIRLLRQQPPVSERAGRAAAAPAPKRSACVPVRPISAATSPTPSTPAPARTRRRRQHRLLPGAAHAGDPAPRHRLRRSVRPRADVVEAHGADRSDAAGVFLAVDGQPDGTVARKRFWRGNFLFAHDPALGSPGFKRFRPIVRERTARCGGSPTPRSRRTRDYGDFSLEQYASSASRISTTAWTTCCRRRRSIPSAP